MKTLFCLIIALTLSSQVWGWNTPQKLNSPNPLVFGEIETHFAGWGEVFLGGFVLSMPIGPIIILGGVGVYYANEYCADNPMSWFPIYTMSKATQKLSSPKIEVKAPKIKINLAKLTNIQRNVLRSASKRDLELLGFARVSIPGSAPRIVNMRATLKGMSAKAFSFPKFNIGGR